MADQTHNPSAERPNQRQRHRWRKGLIVAGVVLVAMCLIGFGLFTASPGYWETPIDGSDPEVVERAQQFEQEFAAETTAVREDREPWQITLTQDEVNEWVAARLPQWLENRGVDATVVQHAERAMIAIKADRVELATAVKFGSLEPIVRLIYEPRLNEAGRVQLTLDSIRAGFMPLPGDALIDQVLEQVGPLDEERQRRVDHARDTLNNLDLVLNLGDGRVVSVVGIELTEGEVTLVCITASSPVRADGTTDHDADAG